MECHGGSLKTSAAACESAKFQRFSNSLEVGYCGGFGTIPSGICWPLSGTIPTWEPFRKKFMQNA